MITGFTSFRSALGLALVLVTAASLAGCGGAVTALRDQQISGRDYSAHLAREYQRLALYEADQMYDRRDAGLFARKALAALDGAAPPPETPIRAPFARPNGRPWWLPIAGSPPPAPSPPTSARPPNWRAP